MWLEDLRFRGLGFGERQLAARIRRPNTKDKKGRRSETLSPETPEDAEAPDSRNYFAAEVFGRRQADWA